MPWTKEKKLEEKGWKATGNKFDKEGNLYDSKGKLIESRKDMDARIAKWREDHKEVIKAENAVERDNRIYARGGPTKKEHEMVVEYKAYSILMRKPETREEY